MNEDEQVVATSVKTVKAEKQAPRSLSSFKRGSGASRQRLECSSYEIYDILQKEFTDMMTEELGWMRAKEAAWESRWECYLTCRES